MTLIRPLCSLVLVFTVCFMLSGCGEDSNPRAKIKQERGTIIGDENRY